MSSGSNKLLYALGAAGALVGAAVIFHLLSSKATSNSTQMLEEIDALGQPKREMNGFLSFNYYKDLFILIQKHAKAKSADEKKEMLARRREYLKSNKLD
jgi:hypothetical protein